MGSMSLREILPVALMASIASHSKHPKLSVGFRATRRAFDTDSMSGTPPSMYVHDMRFRFGRHELA